MPQDGPNTAVSKLGSMHEAEPLHSESTGVTLFGSVEGTVEVTANVLVVVIIVRTHRSESVFDVNM